MSNFETKRTRAFALVVVAAITSTLLVLAGGANAASVKTISVSGGAGTAAVGGTLYAKQGADVTIALTTDADTRCVELVHGTGGGTIVQKSAAAKADWTFTVVAGSGDGTTQVTATAYRQPHPNHDKCIAEQGERFGHQSATYALDNTPPAVTASVAPAANAAGWVNSDATVAWAATDAGSGVASGPTPASDSVVADGTVVVKNATASDRVGNSATGAVEIKLDKAAPAITGTRTPAANSYGWNNTNVTVSFACSDATSGVKGSCPATQTFTNDGSNVFVSGTVFDNAGNSAWTTVGPINIDKINPTLGGASLTAPNAAGWYNGDVTIRWTAADNLGGSGPVGTPADTVITGEGTALTASSSVLDRAGNSSGVVASPGVNIDRTAPNTVATAPATDWNNKDVTIALGASDNLSGVHATYYEVDGGAQQAGKSVSIDSDGVHSVRFWSVDKAGNAEPGKTVQVKIDKTNPSINHSLQPVANAKGWNRTDVTVTFVCNDSVSGVKSCTTPQNVTREGQDQPVPGTAEDNAGNTAIDPATVSVDKTQPVITPAADRLANAYGWYAADVVVSFGCSDALSGADECPATQTLGQGQNQSASGTAKDAADNSATATLSGLNVDKTAPTLAGAATAQPNSNGWYRGDVSIAWTAGDLLSGIFATPANSVIGGEGAALSAGTTVSDRAGNSTSTSVAGIKIDRTAPATSVDVRNPDSNGWYTSAAKISLSATDNLSAVDEIFYSVDGGDAQPYAGAFDYSAAGVHTIRFWSVDNAGNVENNDGPGNRVELRIDGNEPAIVGFRVPPANGFGWNNTSVFVGFQCSDDESGIESCSEMKELATEGANQSATGTAVDRARNSATDTVSGINIDVTAPTLAGAPTTRPNDLGWYNGDVTVGWTAADALSGVDPATVPADTVITGEGSNLAAGPVKVYDKAGNDVSSTLSGIKIDATAPKTVAVLPDSPELLKNGWYTGAVEVSLGANDALSGVRETYFSVDGGAATPYEGVFTVTTGGSHTVKFWSIDNAGNVEDKSAATNAIAFKIDNLAPSIEGARKPAGNEFGWNNGPVAVTFACADGETGIKSCAGDETVSGEGAGQSVTGEAADHAGNKSSATIGDIDIDLTKPSLSGEATTEPNAAGWYNGDVTIRWSASDALSGIDAATAPADSTIGGEGTDLGAGPVSVSDKAGNARSASVSGFKIDRTAPVITGGPTAQPNGNGWYGGAVKVEFTCTDNLSGVAACPTEQVLSGDGADQSVTSGAASDAAGNNADGYKVDGIDIDSKAPQSSAELQCDVANGWCKGSRATVVLSATDQPGLSGVAAIRYAVNGGPEKVAPGGSVAVDVALSGTGRATVAYHAVDNADNVETGNGVEVKWDNVAPTVSHAVNPDANAAGWNKSDATVRFSAVDELGGSGIAFVTPDVVVDDETAGRVVEGKADDVAGNTGTDSVTVKLDKTAPSIAGSRTPVANANGWNNEPVTVHFACDDALSTIKECTEDVTLTQQGAGHSVAGSATDAAGNTAGAVVANINLDTTPPTIAGKPTAEANGNGWYKANVMIEWTVGDDLSGVAAGPANTVIDGEGANLGASATVGDKAGNSATGAVTGIKIDRTKPATALVVPTPLESGWYANAIPVELNPTDALSGVASTHYTVDDGAPQAYTGIFTFGEKGVHTLKFWSVDHAGNVEAAGSKVVKIDDVPPVIVEAGRMPVANEHGWNNSDVTVSFACKDGESSVAGCEPDHVFANEGAGQSFEARAKDEAGNSASTLVENVSIDRTKPELSGAATTDPNAGGWYSGDVTIRWTANDGLSGIDAATVPADRTITGEGSSLGAGPVSVSDKAGNSQSASVSGIKIDRTKPSISGGATAAPNAAGWHKSAVSIKFACADNLSGVAVCPKDEVIEDDGAALSVTSGTAEDVAGNVARGISVGGINIDSKAPTTTADSSCGVKDAWCHATAVVSFAAVDQPGLSGVKEIRYSVNGGSESVIAGPSGSASITLSSTGTASVTFWAVDNAGNAEKAGAVSIKHDNIAPTVSHKLDPNANAAGWNQTNTTVTFSAIDDLGGSGVDETTLTAPQAINLETAGQAVNGQAYDYAGNKGTDSATVKLDKTAPTISGAALTTPNANGWYAGPVTVRFTCGDTLSGIAECPKDAVFNGEGPGQSTSGTAVDTAGNAASTIVSGVNIDTTKPSVGVTGIANGGIYTLGSVPKAECTASDMGSGLAGACQLTVAGGLANGVGTFSYTVSATDKAGNSASATGSYRVTYAWAGFLQPINDTAHQVGTSTSIFKSGSTVPAKFQLKNAAGQVVQAASAPQWLTPVKGSSTAAAVDESVYSLSGTNGSTYGWDGTQYHYNWSTKGVASGFYYRIGAKFDDGNTYYVNIGLR